MLSSSVRCSFCIRPCSSSCDSCLWLASDVSIKPWHPSIYFRGLGGRVRGTVTWHPSICCCSVDCDAERTWSSFARSSTRLVSSRTDPTHCSIICSTFSIFFMASFPFPREVSASPSLPGDSSSDTSLRERLRLRLARREGHSFCSYLEGHSCSHSRRGGSSHRGCGYGLGCAAAGYDGYGLGCAAAGDMALNLSATCGSHTSSAVCA